MIDFEGLWGDSCGKEPQSKYGCTCASKPYSVHAQEGVGPWTVVAWSLVTPCLIVHVLPSVPSDWIGLSLVLARVADGSAPPMISAGDELIEGAVDLHSPRQVPGDLGPARPDT